MRKSRKALVQHLARPREQLRLARCNAPTNEYPARSRGEREIVNQHRKGVRHFKVDHLLSPQERADYLDFLRRPTTTIDSDAFFLFSNRLVL